MDKNLKKQFEEEYDDGIFEEHEEDLIEDSEEDYFEDSEEQSLSTEQIENIIDCLIKQDSSKDRDTELLCGATLLAEQYSENNRYREIKNVALLARELTDLNPSIDDVALKAIPRIIDELDATPFYHVMHDLLANLLIIAYRNGLDMNKFRRDAQKFVKLDILLEHDPYRENKFKAGLKMILASMFSSSELLDMIENPVIGHLRADPVEYTWKWEEIYYDVEDELNRRFKGTKRHMGFCFRFWSEKKELLKKKYGIEWHTPSQMNPRVMFD